MRLFDLSKSPYISVRRAGNLERAPNRIERRIKTLDPFLNIKNWPIIKKNFSLAIENSNMKQIITMS